VGTSSSTAVEHVIVSSHDSATRYFRKATFC
jgi:hypothetical protein